MNEYFKVEFSFLWFARYAILEYRLTTNILTSFSLSYYIACSPYHSIKQYLLETIDDVANPPASFVHFD